MSPIDYDIYYTKHCARYYGWLPASIRHKAQLNKNFIKYFTLCAEQAIDIFMLELEGVLTRDEKRKLPNVIVCEKEPKDAAKIFDLVRPPLDEAILVGELEEILTFQDTEETRDLSPDTDVKSYKIRRLLRVKDLSERIKKFFPFDIINFDPYGNLLNPDLDRNKRYQSIEKIFELQENINDFLLFITTPIYDIDPDCESRLKENFESNVSDHEEIVDALISSLGTIDYDEINENKRRALGVAKSIVISAARSKGWNCNHRGIYVYESPRDRKMLSSVVQCSKADPAPNESTYVEDIVRIIEEMPEYYSHQDALGNQEVKEHLQGVIEYCESVRNE